MNHKRSKPVFAAYSILSPILPSAAVIIHSSERNPSCRVVRSPDPNTQPSTTPRTIINPQDSNHSLPTNTSVSVPTSILVIISPLHETQSSLYHAMLYDTAPAPSRSTLEIRPNHSLNQPQKTGKSRTKASVRPQAKSPRHPSIQLLVIHRREKLKTASCHAMQNYHT